jgi:hypothetical protein
VSALPVEIRTLLRRVARALAWSRALEWGARGVLAAAGGAVLWTLLGTIVPLPVPPLLLLLIGLAAAGAAVLVRGMVPVRDLAPAARTADAELGLAERLSTAVDLVAGRIPATALADRVLRDAAWSARAAYPAARLRPIAPVRTRWAVAAVALALLIGFYLPGFTLPATPARDTAARIQREGRRLEDVARRLEQMGRTERAPQARRTAPEVRALGQRLQSERVDRTTALARIAALERRLQSVRRELGRRIAETLNPEAPASVPESLFRPSATLDQSVRQLRQLAARLSQSEGTDGERADLLQQLAGLAESAEAELPPQTRQKLEEARRQAASGNPRGASEILSDALQEVEGLRAVMADENALRMTERELAESSLRIARGRGGEESGAEARRGETESIPPGAAARRLPQQEGEVTGVPPPRGAEEGSTPGQGQIDEKLGAPAPRLEASTERSRVRGQEGEGQFQTSEILGPGRPQGARAREVAAAPLLVRRADEHLARARIPADLRAVVRRYFMLLAERR